MNEEQGFLSAIPELPDDDATRLVYADWLEERSDPRHEFLRGMVEVRRERAVTPEQRRRHEELSAELADLRTQEWQAIRADGGSSPEGRELQRRVRGLEGRLADLSGQMRRPIPSRLRELAATFDTDWLAIVSDPEAEGCGESGREGWRLRFDFLCTESWADMGPTGADNVRHRDTCDKSVYFCDNLADAREHSQEGHCIAVDLGIIRREGDLVPRAAFVGRPGKEAVR